MEKHYTGIVCGFASLSGEQLSLLRKELKEGLGCRVHLLRKSGLVSGFTPLYRELHGAYLIYSLNSELEEKKIINLVESFGGYPICVVQDGVLNSLSSYLFYKKKVGEGSPTLFLTNKLLLLSLTTLFMYKRNLSFYLLRK